MLNTLSSTPKILGPAKPPFNIFIKGDDRLGKEVALSLPEIQDGYAQSVEFSNLEDLRVGRKQILIACARMYGSGRVETASRDNVLFIWLKPQMLEIAMQIKEKVCGTQVMPCQK